MEKNRCKGLQKQKQNKKEQEYSHIERNLKKNSDKNNLVCDVRKKTQTHMIKMNKQKLNGSKEKRHKRDT
jgi:hypothetical protein